jgi:hypothetical protein
MTSFARESEWATGGSEAIASKTIAMARSATITGRIARAALSALAASTAPEWVFCPGSCAGVNERCCELERLLVLDAPVEPLAAVASRPAALQTFEALAAAICSRVGVLRSTTTIVIRRTTRPARVRAVIR